MARDDLQAGDPVVGLPHDSDVRAQGEQCLNAFTDEVLVVNHDDANARLTGSRRVGES